MRITSGRPADRPRGLVPQGEAMSEDYGRDMTAHDRAHRQVPDEGGRDAVDDRGQRDRVDDEQGQPAEPWMTRVR